MKRILVVEDEFRVQAVIRKRLDSAGYDVIAASDGREGLAKARAEKPDLIVLDLILPHMNGYEVCAALKSDERYRSIPILMLTARSQENDVIEGMSVGADAYMTKPYDSATLLWQIQNLLAETDSPPPEKPAPAE